MKTFADFITEAKKQVEKPNYSEKYAKKVEALKTRQSEYAKAHKDRLQQKMQKRKEIEDRNKEEEKENQEYISHIDNLKKEIRREIKNEYGIKK